MTPQEPTEETRRRGAPRKYASDDERREAMRAQAAERQKRLKARLQAQAAGGTTLLRLLYEIVALGVIGADHRAEALIDSNPELVCTNTLAAFVQIWLDPETQPELHAWAERWNDYRHVRRTLTGGRCDHWEMPDDVRLGLIADLLYLLPERQESESDRSLASAA